MVATQGTISRPARRDQLRLLKIALGIVAIAGACATPAQALSVNEASPRGDVGEVQQVRLVFDEAVTALGQTAAPDPARVRCEGTTPPGRGRWADPRTWLYEFDEPLPPGLRCRVQVELPDRRVTGLSEFGFATGGPAVVQVQPWPGSEVEEDQHFILRLNGAAVAADVQAQAGCEVEGLGERLPVTLVTGEPRRAALRSQRLRTTDPRWLVLACARTLPPQARMRLVWGRGIGAQINPQVRTRETQRFSYSVRPAFHAEFSCERERAGADCLPIRPIRVRFSAPVSRQAVQEARLEGPAGTAPKTPQFDRDDRSEEVSELVFAPPFAEGTAYRLHLPADLRDRAGRPLVNADTFPLRVATGAAPPIAKFASAPFGVVEWTADAMMPVTLRQVQPDLRGDAATGQVRMRRLERDEEVLAWFRRIADHHETHRRARDLGLPETQWWDRVEETDARGRKVQRRVERMVATREVSLLADDRQARRLQWPALQGADPRPFEVVGIPLTEPGYHVLEIESRRLGDALLARPAPMYVRTGVLVTNLGLHVKHGRESSAVWVTSLDRARPVAQAEVAVHDCLGRRLWSGQTGRDGVARIAQPLDTRPAGGARCPHSDELFVTARSRLPSGAIDMSFVFSSWDRGIEPWRFGLPVSSDPAPDARAHTVFDRTLLRAGETVSMKHFLRLASAAGLALPDSAALPSQLRIEHVGSGEAYTQPLRWDDARSASSRWTIPPAAKLGGYRVVMERGTGEDRREWSAGEFRVEAFRIPLVLARLSGPREALIAPAEVPLDLQLSHASGGGLARAPVRATALTQPRMLQFAGQEGFSFEPPQPVSAPPGAPASDRDPDDETGAAARDGPRLVADKLPLVTSAEGAARWLLQALPPVDRPLELMAEISFDDPNGEVQTVATTLPLWPAAVVPGIRARSWVAQRGRARFTALALDTAGRPLKDQTLEVHGRIHQVTSSRKRIVGGLYAWDSRTEVRDLGLLCKGGTNAQGRLDCETELSQAGEVELVVNARDAAGRVAQAATRIWVTGSGDLWFAQDDDDRIDLLPERTRYAPGETARLQVRMPFRQATALVAIEREGVIDTRVVTLRGDDPTVEVKIEPDWSPNVYVTVLAVRGRVRETDWRSIFQWGWREPLEWMRTFWWQGREYRAPSAMVDLSKPTFKLGVAALEVGTQAQTLQVSVTPERSQYGVRETARVRVRVTHAGAPVAGAEVAFAAVDEGLLALRDNESWDLLRAMMQPRAWGVATSTAQGEIIGRRHYGRKAVPAGGGGGRGATRELFDTLLLWAPRVALDAQGEAVIDVPLNDSLTAFRLVAVADTVTPVARFGTGSASVRVSQDLQILSALPLQVREGDRFRAALTLRNTTERAMTVRATLQGRARTDEGPQPIELPPRELSVPAGAAAEAAWDVIVPARALAIEWEAAAAESAPSGRSRDAMKIGQTVGASVPVRTLQSTLQALQGPLSLPLSRPPGMAQSTSERTGAIVVTLQPRLSGALPGLRRYFESYPYTCLEQQVSRAIGLGDTALWSRLADALPTYLDSDGLASYFPVRPDEAAEGSDRLTAYLLSTAHEAGWEWPQAAREQMLDGLQRFVEGRIERRHWSPQPDLAVRRLAALAALARHGRAQPRMLGTVAIQPAQWPTAAVLDWLTLLQRLDTIPQRERRLAEAQQLLRSRLSWSGTTLRFSTENEDRWWWLMDGPDANAARLLLAVMDDPAWREDLPRLVVGHLGRQQRGAWSTTTANAWSVLALERFGRQVESVAIDGRTMARIDTDGAPSQGSGSTPSSPANPLPAAVLDWTAQAEGGHLRLPWPASTGTLNVRHEGAGFPWITVQALAAAPLQAPVQAGYRITRRLSAVERRDPSAWSRGDIVRVRLEVQAASDMSWVVLSDPLPAGARVLGSGLGGDAASATRGERREGTAWLAFEERGADAFRGYYRFMPRGTHVLEYTVRLNAAGTFGLPPSRVEAMYAPEVFGESPNAPWAVVQP